MSPSRADWLGRLSAAAFFGYAWFLVLAGGLLGLFVPRWGPLEFEVFARGVFDAGLPATVLASALNQYRYMKSMEFGFGVFMLLFHREIFTQRKFNRFYLGISLLGAAIRAYSLAVDGSPRPFYVGAVFVELSIVLVVFAHSRRTLAAAGGTAPVVPLGLAAG